ncbi:Aste57867_21207 [Aphanomyces stellatus]|uniref:glucan endo-1,3-beta-D-glucosidase n=1 Tax=Aphanomyces stellatus TaxID=120398 RepID=A0A485LH04_9STRA|nr:hypothetical protein As57867_021139 [Aphanomyces stellatus]VFT97880.1 Aste57867_21207 [Aphanomyces stellatus]
MKALALFVLASAACALDVMLSGINYNPRKGQDWDPWDLKCKSADEVRLDLQTISSITKDIRLYSMNDCNQVELVLPIAKELGLSVWLGLWVDNHNTTYVAEKETLKRHIKSGLVDASITGLHVGSEAIYRKDVTVWEALDYFWEIKNMVNQAGLHFPVTIADVGDTYAGHPELFSSVDVVSANAFPFWENHTIDDCIQYFWMRLGPVIGMANVYNKKIIISETGWATKGWAYKAGIASHENAAIWLNDFHIFATEFNWTYYYYTSFDTTWRFVPSANKTEPEVENYFGLFDDNRELKPHYANLTIKKRASYKAPPMVTMPQVPTATKSDWDYYQNIIAGVVAFLDGLW